MKKHLIASGIVALLLIVGFSGCVDNPLISHPDRNKFIGNWEPDTSSWTIYGYAFESDGALYSMGVKAGTWTIKSENRLELYISGIDGSITQAYDYVFSDNYSTLTLTPVGTSYSYTYHKII